MNKKGQALVEFVIILPLLLCIMLSIIDFGIILYNKNRLESRINDVVNMVQNNEDDKNIKKFINKDDKNSSYKIVDNEKYKTVKLYTSINIITPGLNIILGNPYKIEVDRVIYEK